MPTWRVLSSSNPDNSNTSTESAIHSDGSLIRVRLLVAYLGSEFHGFAYQPTGVPTIAGHLKDSLKHLLGEEVDIICAGRTDAGVHAAGQVVHFDLAPELGSRLKLERLPTVVNRVLPTGIVVRCAELVDLGFHARFSAIARTYRYALCTAPRDPFLSSMMWSVSNAVDVDMMNEACALLVGERDFGAFCKRPDEAASLVRNLTHARWIQVDNDILCFDVSANAFCHQMVRSLVGMLVAIGSGKRRLDDLKRALDTKRRSDAVAPAPSEGLCLWRVAYPIEWNDWTTPVDPFERRMFWWDVS